MMSISNKIIIPFIILLTVLIVMFGYLLYYLKVIEKNIQTNNIITRKVNDISTRINLTRQSTDIYTLSYRFKKDHKYYELVMRNQNEISNLLNEIRPLVVGETGKLLLKNFENSRKEVQKSRLEILNAIEKGEEKEINRSFYIWQVASENNYAELLNFTNYNLHSVERNELVYRDIIGKIYTIGLILVVLTVILILILYFYLYKSISVSIKLLAENAQQISMGNFETRVFIRSNDELGLLAKNLDLMSLKLRKYYRSMQNEVKKKEEEIKRNKAFEEQKDNFMSVASHELKTPVTSLKAFGQLMQKQAKENKHYQYNYYLKRMDDQINKLTGLVSGLLDVTKIQAGKMPYEMKLFDLSKCIEETVEVAREVNKKYEIEIDGSVKKKVLADANRISQVLENFISNAAKYSPENSKIIVKIKNSRDKVTIGVQDFGIGIEKDHQDRIFERFFRVSESEEKTFPGLGIGLYVCAEIIRRHNGEIWVESVKGKGSSFYFSIPYS